MSHQSPFLPMLPLTQEQLSRLQHATQDLTPAQFAWLSGYFFGLSQQPLSVMATTETARYHYDAPFTATVLSNKKITSQHSEKETRHIEISLKGSDLRYQPGDTLGVWFENSAEKVDELIALLWLKGDEAVTFGSASCTLRDALLAHCELTQNNATVVKAYAQLTRHEDLLSLVADNAKLKQYADEHPINEMVRQYCAQPTAQAFVDILNPLTPRFYSIASSQQKFNEEVHLTLGVVRYQANERTYTGGASGFLADNVKEGSQLRIFIEENDRFRLPRDLAAPVIMIGPGTGIAPFRAFMQQREKENATGKNWLFFGNPHFAQHFLYQEEWQHYQDSGLLTHLDLAWSRDQTHKIYVQDKLREQGHAIWQWLQQGAYIYVCGDAQYMAKDVEQALLDIVITHGRQKSDEASKYLNSLYLAGRYQKDVY